MPEPLATFQHVFVARPLHKRLEMPYPGQQAPAPPGDGDLTEVVARLATRLELFEASLAAERAALMLAEPRQTLGFRSDEVSQNVSALIGELIEVLDQLKRQAAGRTARRPGARSRRRRGVRPKG